MTEHNAEQQVLLIEDGTLSDEEFDQVEERLQGSGISVERKRKHDASLLTAFFLGMVGDSLPFLPMPRFKEKKKKVFTSEDAERLKKAEEKRLRKFSKRLSKGEANDQ
jgi:hypothetical protein